MEYFSLRTHESMNTILSLFKPPQGFGINSITGVINTTIMLCHTNDNSSSLWEEFGCPISHITEALNNNSFPLNSWIYT